MPRSKRGIKRVPPDYNLIEKSIDLIKNQNWSIYKAAKFFDLSKNTIKRHLNYQKPNTTYDPKSMLSTNQVFSQEEERLLLDYVLESAKLQYGLTVRNLAYLAYQFAKANNKKYPESWDRDCKAGDYWVRLFRKKYQKEIALRKPEPTSLARSTAFNKHNVSVTFQNYKAALEKCPSIKEVQIWNCDETGITTVHKPPKILAPTGCKQVGSMTSGERGSNVTMIAAINAGGGFIPPMLIFPRVNFKEYMLAGAPPGTIGEANPSGWSTSEIFCKFFDHFVEHVKPTKESPCILLMDNHESHISVKLIQRAKDVGVVLVTFHPHTSHKFQPLDRTVFGPFKTYYNTAMNEHMLTPGNAGKPVTIYDLANLVGKAFPLAFTPSNIVQGFKVTGLSPLDENIFQDDEFAPSNVTDRPLITPSVITPEILDSSEINTAIPSTSEQTIVSPFQVRPLPKAGPRVNSGRGREKGRSRILTDTPEKSLIEEKERERGAKKIKKEKVTSLKRKLLTVSSDESSDSDSPMDILDSHNTRRNPENIKESCKADDFIIFTYDGQYYPGQVIDVSDDSVYIRSMKKTSKSWTWPEKPDEMLYLWEDVIEIIKPPVKIHSRRELYRVKEVEKYFD